MYFSGQGTVYAGSRTAAAAPSTFVSLGNVSSLVLQMGMGWVTNAVGGSNALTPGVRQGDMPRFVLTMEDLNPVNLSTVLYGQSSVVTGAVVAAEAVTATAGGAWTLANMNIQTFATLKNAAGTITYTKGTDYNISTATGLLTFPAGSTCTSSCIANYTFGSYTKTSAGTIAPPYYWLRFDGLNTGNTNEAVVIDIYKTRLSPVQDLPIISDAIVALPLQGRIFRDTLQSGTLADGQFMRIMKL